jgi:hypothetical protein
VSETTGPGGGHFWRVFAPHILVFEGVDQLGNSDLLIISHSLRAEMETLPNWLCFRIIFKVNNSLREISPESLNIHPNALELLDDR